MKLDLLLTGADIVTLEPGRPRARRIGVLHGRIVGFDEELDGLGARRTLDLGGATVVPGFIDAHCHTTWYGLGLGEVDVSRARNLEELYRLVAATAAETEEDVWVAGTGFNQKHFGGAFPKLARLDEATGDRPLYLRHVSGHALIANTAALRRAGTLEPGFRDPAGGKVVRDAAGLPTGVVEEAAQQLVQDLLLPYALDQIIDALERATAQYAREGITSFTEAGIGAGWIGHSPLELTAYLRAQYAGRLHARAQLMPVLDALHKVVGHESDLHGESSGLGLDLGAVAGLGDEYLSLGPVKVFTDGSLLGETAAVTEEFCSHRHSTGYLLDDPESYRRKVRAAYRAGWPIAVHAIGDRAVDLAVDLITECQDAYGRHRLPNRIEHCGITRPDQLARIAAAGAAVTPQAAFIRPLGDQFMTLLGPERSSWCYRGRSFVDAGIVVAGSSDRPVADGRPLTGIQSAIDRRTESGELMAPAEALTPEEALRSYTEWAARATGALADKGTLAPGKLADLVILDGDPLSVPDVSVLTVLATVVGGRFTHDDLDRRAAPGPAPHPAPGGPS